MKLKKALSCYFKNTPTLVQILRWHRNGLTHAEKAERLNCSVDHMNNTCSKIMALFGVNSMNKAVLCAIACRIIERNAPLPTMQSPWPTALSDALFHRYVQHLTKAEKQAQGIQNSWELE